MSRTFRRKDSYLTKEYLRKSIGEDASEKELQKEYHRWHGDKDFGYSPPKDFVKDLNRSFRAKAKRNLYKAIQDNNEAEVIFDPFIKNAGWLYW